MKRARALRSLFGQFLWVWLACGCGGEKEPLGDEPESGGGGDSNVGAPAAGAGNANDGGASDGGASDGSGGASSTTAPYAHVTSVSVSGEDGAYSFSVSIESADIDCSQFADFWEVLAEDGALLYRRILEHSHTDENGTTDPDAPGNTFTREGGPIAIDGARVVVVRAHMSTSGYNGRAMRGSPESGFTEAPDIDGTFAPGVEDLPPKPEICLF
jgi:hypothetical protein